jgi:hypothetical protein
MNAENFSIAHLMRMAHSPVRNYVIPGVTSWLIGEPSAKGTMRLFHSERQHEEAVTPHSHRFDFQCWVLEGMVTNRLWSETYGHNPDADKYRRSVLHYDGQMGKYRKEGVDVGRWTNRDAVYMAGECYSMTADQIHSIFFSRGCKVLFFEGPNQHDFSHVLEPYVNGEAIETMEVKPWMFRREEVPHD